MSNYSEVISPSSSLKTINGALTVSGAIIVHNSVTVSGTLYDRTGGPVMPTGVILAYGASAAPSGWLICNGSAVSRTTYSTLWNVIGVNFGSGNGSTTFHLPDFRGRFLRGVTTDTGRDPDTSSRTAMNPGGKTGSKVGSVQDDAFESHSHNIPTNSAGGSTPGASFAGSGSVFTSNATGGSETRPINAYVQYIIKY
jgi:microcystin-dependent protein